ncbi:helix-turn-helix domain-containing protein [Haloarcula amylovorans]|uniref:helix-turn-helix domain-containing protein n=1 Tax=Haloarcula amylovorans TaxID=2562280 RepID=UPI0010766BE6|nr:helix-turn-helix domain-containing protein [Halomicroarcula amylolytica]
MKHVRLALDAGGREAEVHPMYDTMVNAPFVERATAMHWNFSGDELGIMHYVEGDVDAFEERLRTVTEVLDYELTPAGERAFYAYVRDATNESLRELFAIVTRSPAVVIPPIEYRADGTVAYSVFGPSAEIQAAIDTAFELGYYEIPREASHEAVAEAIGCAPSTVAEHLRKAESKLLGSLLE